MTEYKKLKVSTLLTLAWRLAIISVLPFLTIGWLNGIGILVPLTWKTWAFTAGFFYLVILALPEAAKIKQVA